MSVSLKMQSFSIRKYTKHGVNDLIEKMLKKKGRKKRKQELPLRKWMFLDLKSTINHLTIEMYLMKAMTAEA